MTSACCGRAGSVSVGRAAASSAADSRLSGCPVRVGCDVSCRIRGPILLSIGFKGGSSTENEFACRAPALSASVGAAAKSDWPERIGCEGSVSKGGGNSATFEIRGGSSVSGDHVLALSVAKVAPTSSVALALPD